MERVKCYGLSSSPLVWFVCKKIYIYIGWMSTLLVNPILPISAQCCISYRNQAFVLLCKGNDWFLCEIQHWFEMGEKAVSFLKNVWNKFSYWKNKMCLEKKIFYKLQERQAGKKVSLKTAVVRKMAPDTSCCNATFIVNDYFLLSLVCVVWLYHGITLSWC